jgi:hypothetical protein
MGKRKGIFSMKKFMPFKPNYIFAKQMDVTKEWIDMVRDWCLEVGRYEHKTKLTTTFDYDGPEPHHIDWMADVLELIYPLEFWANSWAQVYEPYGYHTSHNHFDIDHEMSGCLYLRSKESSMFQNPLYPSQHISSPVKQGTTLLWDSAMYHSSPPERGERVILAFNIFDFSEHKFIEPLKIDD